jgi:hypothetical protein
MSQVSFLDSDITTVRFSDRTTWGGKTAEKFHVIEEVWLEEDIKRPEKERRVTLVGVLSVYRNLRENYEFRRRYDDAGKFFIREMELKRKYRNDTTISPTKLKRITLKKKRKKDKGPTPEIKSILKRNNWLMRNLSLTGIYYHLSRYGEDLYRPTLLGFAIVFITAMFFVTQRDPNLIPTLPFSLLNQEGNLTDTRHTIQSIIASTNATAQQNNYTNNKNLLLVNSSGSTYSKFIGFDKIADPIQWQKAFERSLVAFIPLLPSGSEVKIGLADYIIKIVGGVVTFGLIAIALRRKFERKYYH